VTAAEQKDPACCGQRPRPDRGHARLLQLRDAEQYRPGAERADSDQQKRRDSLHGDGYREIGRSPEDVDRRKSSDDKDARAIGSIVGRVRETCHAPIPIAEKRQTFLTTKPIAEVAAIHPKAMAVILTAPAEVEAWMSAPTTVAIAPMSGRSSSPNVGKFRATRGHAFREHVLDVPQAEREPQIQPDCLADNFGPEPVSGLADFLHRMWLRRRLKFGKRASA